MSDAVIAQEIKDAGIIPVSTFPQIFMGAGKALVSPAGFGGYWTPLMIRFRGCRKGCFL